MISLNQEFNQGTKRMTHLCSTMSGASAGGLQGWGLESSEASFTYLSRRLAIGWKLNTLARAVAGTCGLGFFTWWLNSKGGAREGITIIGLE